MQKSNFIFQLSLMCITSETILGRNKILGSKKFWVQNNIGSNKNLGPQNFGVKKNFGSKKNVGTKNFDLKKIWAQKTLDNKIWLQKLDPKKVRKNFCWKKILGPKFVWTPSRIFSKQLKTPNSCNPNTFQTHFQIPSVPKPDTVCIKLRQLKTSWAELLHAE